MACRSAIRSKQQAILPHGNKEKKKRTNKRTFQTNKRSRFSKGQCSLNNTNESNEADLPGPSERSGKEDENFWRGRVAQTWSRGTGIHAHIFVGRPAP
ncbi:hypothetical protein Q1695_008529 [Nippostrongylus brasiliensis]|nr:hypothetical protein Q1695_008529 [Nippostrongylus brasiliensis]